VAAELGVDLDAHRSLPVTPAQVLRADRVFVMDGLTVLRAWRRFPAARPKLFLLDAPREIPDPWGQPAPAFSRVYAQIGGALARLLQPLRE
jgi:protein-tyrosine-phosphatase